MFKTAFGGDLSKASINKNFVYSCERKGSKKFEATYLKDIWKKKFTTVDSALSTLQKLQATKHNKMFVVSVSPCLV